MSDISVGTRIDDRYRVIALIGAGGMANVYRALDTVTHRDVAVKVLRAEYADDAEFVRRFRSEAQAVLNLSHDNIVRSYDVGEWEGNHYIVLEYVPGKTLKEAIKDEAPFDNKRVISIGCQLCDALAHAHERNVVHRDVKPQNVIMGDRGRVKVADFGIARFTDASTVTYMGDKILGSVHYVSPEQARGEKVDAKSDIYSLGIVLYEMATGEVPFDAENTVSVAIKHLQEEMVPPINKNPEISAALNGIIMRATSKEKSARYSNMKELRRDLLRAVREPDTDFAGKAAKRSARTEKPKKKQAAAPANGDNGKKPATGTPMKKTLMLALAMLFVVGLLAAVVLIGSAILNKNDREVRYVPTLTGKTLTEATESGAAMGFVVEVRNRVVLPDVSVNTVIEQEPKAGNQGHEGDTVYVDVSAGPATTEMPKLTSITIEAARLAVQEWGLVLEEVVYEEDENSLPGTVYSQIPEAGTEVYPGDSVILYVNGKPEDHFVIPPVTEMSVADAVSRLREDGFNRIFVREADSGELPGRVVNQLPASGESWPSDTAIELWATPAAAAVYSKDVACNINIETADSRVMAMIEGEGVYYVLFEELMPSGQQTVSVTVKNDTGEPAELVITVNGEEVRRETVTPTVG